MLAAAFERGSPASHTTGATPMAREGERVPELPNQLTYAYWDKGKAKLTPSTGVGGELKKVEAAYKNMKIRTINSLAAAGGPKGVAKAVKDIESLWPKVEATRKSLKDLEKLAKVKAAEAKKSKTFPKKSRTLLDEIASQADLYQLTLRDTPDRMKREAEAYLADYDQRKQGKYDLTMGTHDKLKKHKATADKADVEITRLCKAALLASRNGSHDEAKAHVHNATKELEKIDKSLKACETDSKIWRTDKSGNLDDDDSKVLIPHANGIMTINKEVRAVQKKSETTIKQVHDAVAKLASA